MKYNYLIVLSLIFILLLEGNPGYSQILTKNENGTFKGTYEDTSPEYRFKYLDHELSFTVKYKISIALWQLAGEPIYDYKLLWQFNSIKVGYKSIYKSSSLYQNLMRIKPSVDAKLDLKFQHSPQGRWSNDLKYSFALPVRIDLPDVNAKVSYSVPGSTKWKDYFIDPLFKVESFTKKYVNAGENKGYVTSFHNHVVIPENEAIVKKASARFNDSKDALNAFLIMNCADKLIMSNHQDKLNLSWPENELKKILKEYLCREKILEECNDDQNKKNQHNGEDSFWDMEENVEQEQIQSTASRTNQADSNSPNKQQDKQSFWDMEEESENSSFWDMNEESGTDDFWDNTSNNNNKYKIAEQNGKYGLVDENTNKTIIPYKYDRIYYVKDGILKVSKITSVESVEYRYCWYSTVDYIYQDTYFVDIHDKIISAKSKGLSIEKHSNITLSLTTSKYNETAEERRKREAKKREAQRKKDECKKRQNSDIARIKRDFINQGGQILETTEGF